MEGGSDKLSTGGSNGSSQVFEQRGAALFECIQVLRLVVRDTILPTAKEDANPVEGQGPNGGVMSLSAGSPQLVVGLGPSGSPQGMQSKFMEGLPQEFGASVAAMHDGGAAAAFGHRGNAAEILHRGRTAQS